MQVLDYPNQKGTLNPSLSLGNTWFSLDSGDRLGKDVISNSQKSQI